MPLEVPFYYSLSAHAARSDFDVPRLNTLPSKSLAPPQLGLSTEFVLPMPLPPEVAKGMTVLPESSQPSRKVFMILGATYHQV